MIVMMIMAGLIDCDDGSHAGFNGDNDYGGVDCDDYDGRAKCL